MAVIIGHCTYPVMPAWMNPALTDRARSAGAVGPWIAPSSLSHSGRPSRRAARVDSH